MGPPNDDAPSGGHNSVLRLALAAGTLSVTVAEADIRRGGSGEGGGSPTRDTINEFSVTGSERPGSGRSVGSVGSTLSAKSSASRSKTKGKFLSSIETDYILQISSTTRVTFDGSAHQSAGELEPFQCSKQYVDIRHLANALQDCAEDVVKYYEEENGAGKRSYFSKGVESLLKKPKEAAHFVTNTESKSSHLASELDKINSKMSASSPSDSMRRKLARRNSAKQLDSGAPDFVREVLVGVDKFYEAIYSEKRQFGGKKTHYDHVKTVAERRKEIINKAFGALIESIGRADVARTKQYEGRVDLYSTMEFLVSKIEAFLLTDVVVPDACAAMQEEGRREDSLRANREGAVGDSMVTPKSTRRRKSFLEREEEEKNIREAATQLVTLHSKDELDDSISEDRGEVKSEGGTRVPIGAASVGLLPEHPTDFAIVVVVATLFFKSLEGRTVDMQVDILVMACIACGLAGYHLAGLADRATVSGAIPSNLDAPQSKEEAAGAPRRPRPSLADVRSMGQRSMGSRDLRKDLSEGQRTHQLLRATVSVRGSFAEKRDAPNETTPVVPAKTFPKFPDGAALGSHLNCWSAPLSSHFKVRGPNYLKDKKKVPSGEYLFPTRGCDLFLTDLAPTNLGRNRSLLEGRLRDVPTFIVNYRLPWGVFLSYHEIPARFLPFLRRGNGHGDLSEPLPSMVDMPPGDRAACNFLLADSKEKDAVWKIVPVVAQGPWVVKKVVGGKPAILGKQLPVSYVYRPPKDGLAEYLEADLDIVSSAAARNILAVVRSYTQVLTVDLGFVVQGNTAEELPEQMMLGLRLHGLDPLTAEMLPEFDDEGEEVPGLGAEGSGDESD